MLKKFYYFTFIFTHYMSCIIDSLLLKDVISLILGIYLICANTLIISKKKINTYSSCVFLINVLMVYPYMFFRIESSNSILLVIGLNFLIFCLYFTNKFYTLNREVLLLLLTIFTLNSGILSLYISVNDNNWSTIVIVGLLHFLCFTCVKNSKIIKKKSKRVKSVKEVE